MKGITLIALSLFLTVFLSFTPINKKYIIIDASHGGNDFGATYGEFSEKNIALSVAKEIQRMNAVQDKYEIILTRDSDTFPTLSERTDQINKLNPELVISLHINKNFKKETPDRGFEIFVQNSEASKQLAEKISKKFDTRKIEGRNFHILRETKIPAVLVEMGYINNTQDREYLTSIQGQKEIAQKFVEIINEY